MRCTLRVITPSGGQESDMTDLLSAGPRELLEKVLGTMSNVSCLDDLDRMELALSLRAILLISLRREVSLTFKTQSKSDIVAAELAI